MVAGPPGDAFYAPPPSLVAGPSGTLVWSRPASALTTIAEAATASTVIYRSRDINGKPSVVSGQIMIPRGPVPAGGWPVAAWGHITTGAGDACAPSRATPGDPELSQLLRGDQMAAALLGAGIAVVRSDYEGIGTPGPHPYLIGSSLGRATIDLVKAAHSSDPDLSKRWVAVGHSEGGVASLFAGTMAAELAPELELRGVDAIAPPLRTRTVFDVVRQLPISSGPLSTVPGLASLVLAGAALDDPRLAELYQQGALSPRALELLPDVETRCSDALTRSDTWGGLPPNKIAGPRGPALTEGMQRLHRVLDRNDAINLRFPRSLPVRIDQGQADLVAPRFFADEFVLRQLARGKRVSYRTYRGATHANVANSGRAAEPATRWIAAQLR